MNKDTFSICIYALFFNIDVNIVVVNGGLSKDLFRCVNLGYKTIIIITYNKNNRKITICFESIKSLLSRKAIVACNVNLLMTNDKISKARKRHKVKLTRRLSAPFRSN